MLSSVLAVVYQQLTAFAGLEGFWARFEAVLGMEYDADLAQSIRAQWQAGDFSQFPPIEVISGNILGKALGGYASSKNTIYLADWFVAEATAQDLGAVVLEEIGHWLDAQVNVVDTPGDEGELFVAQVLGKPLTASQLTRIKSKDDTAIIYINGEPIEIEQSSAYPNFPWIIGIYDTTGYIAFDVEILGNYAYIANGSGGACGSGRLQIIDISDPTTPTFIGSSDQTFGDARDVKIVGNYAYIAKGFGGLEIIDISDPNTPIFVASHDTNGNAFHVDIMENYAYIADDNGLEIINIINPNSPTFVGRYTSYSVSVEIVSNYAYIASGDGLEIINIINPNSPTFVGHYNGTTYAEDIEIVGSYAYIADGNGGLKIIDISNPTALTLVGSYTTYAKDVEIVGNYAYIASGDGGLEIIDISNPTAPTFVGSYDTPGGAWDVEIVGNYAYIADSYLGLKIIDISHYISSTLQFSQATYQVNENGTLVGSAITVTRTGNTDLAATVTLNLTDGTATAPADYDNTPITVNFAVGETEQTITIPIVNDTIPEANETVTLSLVNPSEGHSLGGQSTATLTIIEQSIRTTIRLTNNSTYDGEPQVSGNNIVWVGNDENDDEIYFYDGSQIIQLTNNDTDDRLARISGNNVVWVGNDGSEIYFYNGSVITQIFKNVNQPGRIYQIQVSGNNIVWTGPGRGGTSDIYFYDGTKINQLTDTDYYYESGVQISGNNIVWQRNFMGGIYLYDGNNITLLPDTLGGYFYGLQISGNNVVWYGYDNPSDGDYEIYLYDGTETIQLTDNNTHDSEVDISGNNIVWVGVDNSGYQQIYFYDGNEINKLTNSTSYKSNPKVSGNNIVWRKSDRNSSNGYQIYFYDGATISQIPNGLSDELFAYIPNLEISVNTIVWTGANIDNSSTSDNYEIYFHQIAPVLPIVSTIQFSQATYQVNENGTLVGLAITVTRTGNADLTATVTLNLTDGTATAPADYDNTPITVNFAVGETEQTITIPIVNDTLPEDNETVTLSLVNPSEGYSLGGQSTATLTIIDDDGGSPSFPTFHQLLEIFAKDSVYEDWQIGQDADLDIYPDSGYIVDEVFNDLSTGFYGLGLVNTNPSFAPILVLRGTEFTEGYGDILADLQEESIGYNQYEANSENVFTWLGNNGSILFPHITGHSLGGSLSQLIAANYTGNLGEVVTFNSPGISTSEANKFNANAGKAEGVTHYIQIGDLFSMAGEAYIDGNAEYDVKLFSYDNFLSAINFEKHVVPMLVDRTSGYVKPNYEEPRTITSAELSNPSFSYYDYVPLINDYFYLQFLVYGLDSQLGLSISERGTTENSRQIIANTVRTGLDTLNNAGKIELPDLAFAINDNFNPDQLFTLGDDITENAILGLKSEDVSLRYVDGDVPYYLINGTLTGSTSLLKYINSENKNFTVTADFADPNSSLLFPEKYIKISPTRVDLVGDISVENLVVSGFGLEELVIKIDTIVDTIDGTLKLVTPAGGLAGGIGFVRNSNTQEFELNSLSAGGVNLNIPLATDPSGLTVLYFQDLILEYENFAEGATEPLGFGVDSRFTYKSNEILDIKLPDWLGGFQLDIPTFLALDVGGKITTESISADGQLKVLEIPDSSYALGSGTAEIELNWKNKYLQGSFELEVLEGLAQNSGEFDINLSRGDFTFLGTGSLNLPSISLLNTFGISGITLGSTSARLEFTNDSNFSNDYFAAWGEIFLLGQKGIRVNLDGSYSVIGAQEINALSSGFRIQPLAMASFSIFESDIQSFNINPIVEETFPVNSQLPWIAFVANWENAADAEIELIAPDGTVYTEADIALSETINFVDELTTDISQVIHVADPQLGDWSIRVVNGDSLGLVEFSAFTDVPPPTLNIGDIKADSNGNFIINYEVGNSGDNQTQYTFYVDDNQDGFDGLIIGNSTRENDGKGTFIWDGEDIASGQYYIYGVITSENSIPAFSNYSMEMVNLTDGDTPIDPEPPTPVDPEPPTPVDPEPPTPVDPEPPTPVDPNTDLFDNAVQFSASEGNERPNRSKLRGI